MANKIKVIGYAQRVFYTDGIEYRNFSPDLVGTQLTSNGGTPLFTATNFAVTTNLDGKTDKIFVTNSYGEFTTLSDLEDNDIIISILNQQQKTVKLNLDKNDVLNYAYFGSLREYIRVSLENIIINWPASLYVTDRSDIDITTTGATVLNYSYDNIENQASFSVSANSVTNIFGINYTVDGSIVNTYNETNSLRNLPVSYTNYVIAINGNEYPILEFTGSTGIDEGTLNLVVFGNPFSAYTESYHIRPNILKIEEFFLGLNDFESSLLNRHSDPIYTSRFKIFFETTNGSIIETYKKVKWPVSDGYNIDFNSIEYANFVTALLDIADANDSTKSNLMTRFLVASSISEFDTVPDIENDYTDHNGQKMTNTLRIYGREFDELKKYSDGIAFANTVTYNKKNNTPDAFIKHLSRVLGWGLTTSLTNANLVQDYLTRSNTVYSGMSAGLTPVEAETELWRRIILNSPWLWKSKGTRKGIEFLLKFIGAPDNLVTFNEYVYVAKKPLNMELVNEMMAYFNDDPDISGLVFDDEGYPTPLPDTPEMYFQMFGQWYRETGGPNPDIDILEGNNPHIGPYDGGQAYIDQFRECLIPNFEGVDVYSNVELLGDANLFTNFTNGTFDECCGGNLLTSVTTNIDYDAILQEQIDNIVNNNPVTETGCTFTNTWTLQGYLDGVQIYSAAFLTGATAPTRTQVHTAIDQLSGTTELSGMTTQISGDDYQIIINNSDCDILLNDSFLRVQIQLSVGYNCADETVTGLTAFLASRVGDNGCTAISALPVNITYYHDGASVYPTFGDRIYLDSFGTIPANWPEGEDKFIGGSISSILNWIRTDANGYRITITC